MNAILLMLAGLTLAQSGEPPSSSTTSSSTTSSSPTPSSSTSTAPVTVADTVPPAPTQVVEASSAPATVLVLNLDASGIDPKQAKAIDDIVGQSVSRAQNLRVMTAADVGRVADVEAQRS